MAGDEIAKYDLLIGDEPIQYGGFKLFYKQDTPLLPPEEVLELASPFAQGSPMIPQADGDRLGSQDEKVDRRGQEGR